MAKPENLQAGDVYKGYVFMGGDPSQEGSWAHPSALPPTFWKDRAELANMGDTRRGWNAGVDQLQGLAYGAVGLAGGATGLDSMRDFGLRNAQEQFHEAEKYGKDIYNIDNAQSFGDYVDAAQYGVGTVLPMVGQSVVSALAGGAAGSAVGPAGTVGGAVTGLVGRGALKRAVTRAAEQAAERGATALEKDAMVAAAKATAGRRTMQNVGAMGGAFASNSALEAGGIYHEQDVQGIDEPLRAMGYGAAAGALDTLTEFSLLGSITGRAGSGAVSRLLTANPEAGLVRRTMTGMAKTGTVEGLTEPAQSYLERRGAYQPTGDAEAMSDYRNSAFVGGVAGVLGGGIGGAVRGHAPSPTESAEQIAARMVVEDRVAAEQRAVLEAQQQAEAQQAQVLEQARAQKEGQLRAAIPWDVFKEQHAAEQAALKEQRTAVEEQARAEYAQLMALPMAQRGNIPDTEAKFVKQQVDAAGLLKKVSAEQAYDAFIQQMLDDPSALQQLKVRTDIARTTGGVAHDTPGKKEVTEALSAAQNEPAMATDPATGELRPVKRVDHPTLGIIENPTAQQFVDALVAQADRSRVHGQGQQLDMFGDNDPYSAWSAAEQDAPAPTGNTNPNPKDLLRGVPRRNAANPVVYATQPEGETFSSADGDTTATTDFGAVAAQLPVTDSNPDAVRVARKHAEALQAAAIKDAETPKSNIPSVQKSITAALERGQELLGAGAINAEQHATLLREVAEIVGAAGKGKVKEVNTKLGVLTTRYAQMGGATEVAPAEAKPTKRKHQFQQVQKTLRPAEAKPTDAWTEDQYLANGYAKVTKGDGTVTWAAPEAKATNAGKVAGAKDNPLVPLDQVPHEMRPVVWMFMGMNDAGEVDPDVTPKSYKALAKQFGESHTVWMKRLDALGYTQKYRNEERLKADTPLSLEDEAGELDYGSTREEGREQQSFGVINSPNGTQGNTDAGAKGKRWGEVAANPGRRHAQSREYVYSDADLAEAYIRATKAMDAAAMLRLTQEYQRREALRLKQGTKEHTEDAARDEDVVARAARIRETLNPKVLRRLDLLMARYADGDFDEHPLGPQEKVHAELDALEQIDRDTPKASVAGETSGQTASALRASLRRMFRMGVVDGVIQVVDTVDQLPEAARKFARSAQGENTGMLGLFDPTTNKVWLIANHIPEGRELSVVLHEVGVHMGMKNLLGEANYDALVKQLRGWLLDKHSLEGKLARRAQARVMRAQRSMNTKYRPGLYGEELLAYFVEEATMHGAFTPLALEKHASSTLRQWLNRLLDAMRAALDKLGLNPRTLTAQNVVDLAYAAAHKEFSFRAHREPQVGESRASISTLDAQQMASEGGRRVVSALGHAWAKAKPSMLTLHQMADQYGAEVPALETHVELTDAMDADQHRLMQKAHAILTPWAALPKQSREALNWVMHTATLKGIHPDLPLDHELNAHLTEKDRGEYNALKSRFNVLSKDAQDVYRQARTVLSETWNLRREVYAQTVTAYYDDLIADATKQGHTDRIAKLTKERDATIAKYTSEVHSLKGPYFPLLRFGDMVVVARSAEYKALEDAMKDMAGAEHREAAKKLDAMKQQAAHYAVQAFESRREADLFSAKMKAQGMHTHPFLAEQFARSQRAMSAAGVEQLKHLVDSQFDRGTSAKVKEAITAMFVSNMPENAAIKRQMRRRGVEGATMDMMRAFAEVTERDSFHLSRLKHAKALAVNMQQMRAEANKSGFDAGYVFRDVQDRIALDYDYRPTPVQNLLARLSGIWHLGVAPSFLLTNMTQPWLITVPQLAGRHGVSKTMGAMRSSWVVAGKIIKAGKDGVFNLNDADLQKALDAGVINREHYDVLHRVRDLGQLDITQNLDMGLVSQGVDPARLKAMRVFNWATHHIELHNRIATALAAYDLERARQAKHPTNATAAELVEAAQTAAYDAVVRTQLDYSNTNAAWFMKHGALPFLPSKLVFQFRKYQQGMIYLLARNAQLAFKGDREALRSLGYLMATSAMVGGLRGLPPAVAFFAIASLFSADDDEAGDAETKWRNYLSDSFGPDAARVLHKGLPTLLGLDVSQNLSMGNLIDPLPFTRVKDVTDARTAKAGLGGLMVDAGGATFGMLTRWLDAGKLMGAGDFDKGLEKLLPKFVSSPLKAARYGTEGMTTRAGAQSLEADRFDGWDLAYRALGFSPSLESEHYAAKQGKEDASRAIKERRSAILARYAEARRTGKGMAGVREDIDAFNKDHKTQRITQSVLLRSLRARKKLENGQDETGVGFRKHEKALEGITRFAR
jgi:hypothetical protein